MCAMKQSAASPPLLSIFFFNAPATTQIYTLSLHDALPIYETLAMGLVALWLWRARDRYRPGILFAFYLVLAGIERLLVEFVRRNKEVFLGLTIPQLLSVVMIAGGIALAARVRPT